MTEKYKNSCFIGGEADGRVMSISIYEHNVPVTKVPKIDLRIFTPDVNVPSITSIDRDWYTRRFLHTGNGKVDYFALSSMSDKEVFEHLFDRNQKLTMLLKSLDIRAPGLCSQLKEELRL